MEGNTQLADHDHVEWRTEGLGNLEGHRHSAPWQSENDDVLSLEALLPEQFGEPLTGIGPVAESHYHLPLGLVPAAAPAMRTTADVSRTHSGASQLVGACA